MPRKYSNKRIKIKRRISNKKGGANTNLNVPNCQTSLQEYPFFKTPCATLPLDSNFYNNMNGGGYSFDFNNPVAGLPSITKYHDANPPKPINLNTIQSTLQKGGKRKKTKKRKYNRKKK